MSILPKLGVKRKVTKRKNSLNFLFIFSIHHLPLKNCLPVLTPQLLPASLPSRFVVCIAPIHPAGRFDILSTLCLPIHLFQSFFRPSKLLPPHPFLFPSHTHTLRSSSPASNICTELWTTRRPSTVVPAQSRCQRCLTYLLRSPAGKIFTQPLKKTREQSLQRAIRIR